MSALPKPQLRNLLTGQIKKTLVQMMVISLSGSALYKVFVKDKREQRYKEFYKTYDAEKQLKKMNETGLMQSYIVDK